jgi:DNA polymerase III delta subunit
MNYRNFCTELHTLSKALSAGKSPRLVVLWGPSALLVREALATLKTLWHTRCAGQFQSLEPEDWADADGQKLALLCGQESLFEPAPLYYLRRAERVEKWPALVGRALKGSAGEHLLCVSVYKDKLPAAANTFLKSQPDACSVSCFPPLPGEMRDFTQELLAKSRLSLAPAALRILLDSAGDDADTMANEVAKLALVFPAAEGALSADAIAPYLGVLREDQAFGLSTLLRSGDFGGAHLLCQRLLLQRESAIALLGIISRHVRISLQTSLARRRQLTVSEQVRLFNLPLGTVRDYNQAGKKPNLAQLYRSFAACQQADMVLKSRPHCSEDLVLAELIEGLAPSPS